MKLSIIIPVYNLENYIAKTLDSLLNINFSNKFEIIAVNDGSTDSSETILNQYKERYKNITVISVPNGGVSNARNLGIKKANGEYITFVDGDDTVDPNFFEKAVRELDNGGYDFVQGNYVVIEKDKVFNREYIDRDTESNDFYEMMNLFFRPGKKRINNNVWAKVFRAEVVHRVSFDTSLAVAEDQKYVFDVLRIAKKIKLLKDVCIHYYQRESSAIHTFSIAKEWGKIDVLDYCKSYIMYSDITSFIELNRMNLLIGIYYYYTKSRDSQAGEIRKKILRLYTKEQSSLTCTKTKLILMTMKYARCVLDLYIRRKMRGKCDK